MESFALSFASMLLALAVVIGLAWVALRLLRDRLQPRVKPGAPAASDDALRFVRALPVGAKERVVIVEHRGARWMLGVSAGGISTIAHWPAAAAGSAVGRDAAGDSVDAGRS
jgi:flagellar protein FliO/FliZ